VKSLAVWTIKGGVGKTAAAVNLAALAAGDGLRTLLWDLDPQGAASFYLRIAPRVKGGARRVVKKSADLAHLVRTTDHDNLHLLPADFSYRHLDLELDGRKNPSQRLAKKLAGLRSYYDLVLLDCPPSVSLISESVLCAVDLLLLPVIPSTLSLRTLEQVRDFAAEVAGPELAVLPFLSMVDRRKRLHRETCAAFADGAEGFARATIPSASIVERMGLSRTPLTLSHPGHPAARAFASLWREVRGKVAV
jgi:cellulose biosynthesis protein BcsQ